MANVSSGSGYRTDGVNISKRANAGQGFNSNILNDYGVICCFF